MSFVEMATIDKLKDGQMIMVTIDDHEYMLG